MIWQVASPQAITSAEVAAARRVDRSIVQPSSLKPSTKARTKACVLQRPGGKRGAKQSVQGKLAYVADGAGYVVEDAPHRHCGINGIDSYSRAPVRL